MRETLFIDMDGVLADWPAGADDNTPGLFGQLPPMPGAIEAMQQLYSHYDLFILSTAPWANPSAWADKSRWVRAHLPFMAKRLTLTHRKDLLIGDILVDDRPNNGAKDFRGEWIRFGSNRFPDWDAVLTYLIPPIP